MRGQQETFRSDISEASAVHWLVYTPNAGISRRHWRRLIATDSGYRSVMKGWWTRSNLSYHVCSPDTAIPNTRYAPSGVFSETKLSMNFQTTKAQRHHSSRRWCLLNQYRSLQVWKKRRRTGITWHTSTTSTQNLRDHRSLSHSLGAVLSDLPWLPSKLFEAASSATDSRSSYVTFTST